jgi:hypothetical protein
LGLDSFASAPSVLGFQASTIPAATEGFESIKYEA